MISEDQSTGQVNAVQREESVNVASNASQENDNFIACQVCDNRILVNSTHGNQLVLKCSSCTEATPIKAAPPGKRYVRCQCNCLLICRINSSRVGCPRENCNNVITIRPMTNNAFLLRGGGGGNYVETSETSANHSNASSSAAATAGESSANQQLQSGQPIALLTTAGSASGAISYGEFQERQRLLNAPGFRVHCANCNLMFLFPFERQSSRSSVFGCCQADDEEDDSEAGGRVHFRATRRVCRCSCCCCCPPHFSLASPFSSSSSSHAGGSASSGCSSQAGLCSSLCCCSLYRSARCPHCRHTSSIGPGFARCRQIASFVAFFLMLCISIAVTMATMPLIQHDGGTSSSSSSSSHSHTHAGGGTVEPISYHDRRAWLIVLDCALFLATIVLLIVHLTYCMMKVSSVEVSLVTQMPQPNSHHTNANDQSQSHSQSYLNSSSSANQNEQTAMSVANRGHVNSSAFNYGGVSDGSTNLQRI